MKHSELDPIRQRWLGFMREKARFAVIIDLQNTDWEAIDPAAARKIHALLPPDTPKPSR